MTLQIGEFIKRFHDDLLRIDLTGVAFLVTGSFIPGVYFGFHCVPNLRDIYLILTGFVLLVGLIAPWITYKIGDRLIRPYILASLVVLGLVPCVHWAFITPQIFINKLYFEVILMFFWYAVGFAVFTTRYPEKAFPKRDSKKSIKLIALKTLQKLFHEVGEEYLLLLPECLPFLSELLEDDDQEIVEFTSTVIKSIEELSGEELDNYLK
eukprot:gene16907-22396_t